MKIIQWNCNMAFRRKHESVTSLKPDILVICECENAQRLKFGELTPTPNDFFWYGDNEHKGIGVFSYSDYRFELVEDFNPEFRYVIPLRASNGKDDFILFAIWAMDNKERKEARYIAQVWLAIQHYSNLFHQPSILIGDFNSNKIWDHEKRLGSHSDVVNFLGEKEIFSLHHKVNKEEHGEEKQPTFFLHRKKEKPYHLDYCFTSKEFWSKKVTCKIGKYEDWIALSDHSPIEIDFK